MCATGSARRRTLGAVADGVIALHGDGIVRVGVDGVDGAGKTSFAEELATELTGRGVEVVRASVDGFHHPTDVRYRRGRRSPEGFFRDSYDYDALRRLLLDPLGPGGDGRYVPAIYDVDRERPVIREPAVAPERGVLVFDGIFLHRAELRDWWDYSVFLDVDFSVSIPRGLQRLGFGDPDPDAEINRRYVEGQRIYLRECNPARHATVVIDNNDLSRPRIIDRTDEQPPADIGTETSEASTQRT